MKSWGVLLEIGGAEGTRSKLLKLRRNKMNENVYSDGEGFEIMAETDLGDLSEVQEQKVLIPPQADALFTVRKVTNYEKVVEGKITMKQLNISLALENGIGAEGKYKGSIIFTRITYWVDKEVYTKDFFKNNQHLVALKKLLIALGYDIHTVKVNDALLIDMSGKSLLATIKQKNNKWTTKDGEEIEEMINEVVNFKPVPAEMRG